MECEIFFLTTIPKPSSVRRCSQNLQPVQACACLPDSEGVTMTVKPWMLGIVALVGLLTVTPALATSFCGDRLDSGGPLGGGRC